MVDEQLFAGVQPRVYATDYEEPEDGRVFVWARTRWYERLEGASGGVAFLHVADSDEEVKDVASREGAADLTELDDDFARMVIQEFVTQSPLYPEAPELSDEEPFSEQKVDVESVHLHYTDEAAEQRKALD